MRRGSTLAATSMGLHVIMHPTQNHQAGFSILSPRNFLSNIHEHFYSIPFILFLKLFIFFKQNEDFQTIQHFAPKQDAFNQRKHTITHIYVSLESL
jgi:hypothetical protein